MNFASIQKSQSSRESLGSKKEGKKESWFVQEGGCPQFTCSPLIFFFFFFFGTAQFPPQRKKKMAKMQEGDFFAQYQLLSERLTRLVAHHGSVNAGSWQLLIEVGNQVLAECVAQAVKLGEEEPLPENLPEMRIPEGFKRCNGPCKRVLPETAAAFQRDKTKKTGFRGRCKVCLSTKNAKKRDAEEEEEEGERKDVEEVGLNVIISAVADGSQVEVCHGVDMDGDALNVVNPPAFIFCNEKQKSTCGKEFSLDIDGFEVIRDGFTISEEEFEQLKHHAIRRMVPEMDVIFNNAAAGDERNDQLRSQIDFKKFVGTDSVMAALQQRLNGKLREMFPWLEPNDMVVLRSDPGCADQRSHTDYTKQDLLRRKRQRRDLLVNDMRMPLASVVAVMPNTFFDVWPGAIDCFGQGNGRVFSHLRLVLNPGDLLIFRGDLVHGGAAFDTFNIRIHTYMDLETVRRTKDTTFYMDAEGGCDFILPRFETRK